jgi:uncharacterized membrane protein YtjA (UPF0391 family)
MLTFLIIPAVIFLVFSIVAGIFGFRGFARAGCLVSRIIFFLLVAGFIITVVTALIKFIF